MIKEFRLDQLDLYLKNNTFNTVRYLDLKGELIQKTYSELYNDALNVMNNLLKTGIKHGDSFLIVGKNSYYWLVTEVACTFIGVETIAIPENFSQEQIIEFIDRYKTEGIAIDQSIYENMPLIGERFKKMLFLNDDILRCDEMICNEVNREQADFKIKVFTSGTTSKIKSFSINKHSTEKMMERLAKYFNMEPDDAWLICHPFSHYSHLEYALGGLGLGYNIIIVDVTYALLRIKKLQPSVLISVPETYYFFYNKLQNLLKDENDPEKRKEFIKEYFGGKVKGVLIGAAPSRKEVKDYFVNNGFPMYEGYGLTETGMVSIKKPSVNSDTVGKIFDGIEVTTDEAGIIHIKNDIVRTEKYDNYTDEENKRVFPEPGHIITGDIGAVDDEGYLFIKGRVKDILILSSGKKINAFELEEKVLGIKGVKQCLAVGNELPYIISIVVTDKTADKAEISEQIHLINTKLAEHEKIKDVIFTEEAFTVENNLLTRSGKIIRKAIEKKYEKDISMCY